MQWLNVIIGVWLIVAPFVLNFGGVARGNSILFGALVALIALVAGARKSRREMRATAVPPGQQK